MEIIKHFPGIFFTFLLSCFVLTFAQEIDPSRIIPVNDPNNILFTFGSYNPFVKNNKGEIFSKISQLNPDVWVWLGGVTNIDLKHFPDVHGFTDEKKMSIMFSMAKNNSEYTKLREATKVIGTWDDHDYGKRNGGKNFKLKDKAQQLWLDFIDEPKESQRRKRKGIYESYYLGDENKIKVILLDVRYFRDERLIVFTKGQDILGEEQWTWLENEFKHNKAEYVLIGSGSQILPDDRILTKFWYTESRDRLISLIRKYKVGGVIFLSGDVHFAEIMKYPCKERIGFELYEFTSSGLSVSVIEEAPQIDKFMPIGFPNTWNTNKDFFLGKNFGVLKFTFGQQKGVRFEARDEEGLVLLEKDVPYSELIFDEGVLDDFKDCIIDTNRYMRFLSHNLEQIMNGEVYICMVAAALLILIFILVFFAQLCLKGILYVALALFARLVKPQKVKSD